MDAANIRILIEANSTGVASGLTPGLTAINKFEQDVKGSLQRVGAAWNSLSTGTQILAGFGVAAGLAAVAIGTTIRPAIEFESAFAGVKKTVDGTPMQLAGIRDGLIEMSTVMPTSAKQLADIAANAGQLGVKAPQILEFTRTIAMLGETTDLDFEEAAQSLARFLNITGNDAPISRLADVIVELGNNSATTESQIVDFGMRLASAFTVAGATESEILALAAAFSSLGLRAEAGGSALSTIITKISDAAITGGKELQTLAQTSGLLPEQFARIAKENPTEALLLFGEGLGKIVREGGSVTPILEELGIGGLRTSEVMRLLALNSDQVRTAIGLAAEQFENGGAAAEEAGRRYETTASRLEILRNRITAIQIAVGTNFLSIFARGADEAGDAIAALADLLTPLGQELLALFRNGAQLAAAFWDTIGGPTAKAAVAALLGLSTALTAALEILNGFGPAGLAIAGLVATLAGFGPAVRPLVATIDGLSASIYRIGTAGSAARTGLQVFVEFGQAAFLGAITVALVSMGSAMANAAQKADEMGESFRSAFSEALASNNFDDAVTQIERVRTEMQRMDEIDKVSTGWGGGWESWSTALKSAVQIMTPFTENTVVNARAGLEELKKVAEENGFDVFESRIVSTARQMGVSESNVLRLANQMGVLEAFTSGTAEEFSLAQNTLIAFADSTGSVSEALSKTKDELLESADSVESLSTALGISQANLEYVATAVAGVKFEDLFSEDPEVRMDALNRVTVTVLGTIEDLADQVGLSTDEFIEQNRVLAEAASANDALESAIRGVVDALNSLNDPQERYNQALADYEEKLAGAGGGMAEFAEAAMAGREAIAQFAGTAPSFDELIRKQQELALELYDVGTNAGYGRDEVLKMVGELFNIPESVLIKLLADAQDAKEKTDQTKEDLNDLTGEAYELILDADPELAMEVFNAMRLEKTDFVEPVSTSLGATMTEAEAAFGAARLAKTDYAQPATVPLRADISDAVRAVEVTRSTVNTFVGAKWEARYTADNSDAVNKANVAAATGQQFAARKYLAHYEGDNSDGVAKARQAQGEATKYGAMRPRAVLTAKDDASGVIQGAIDKLRGFQSKSITLTVRNVSIGAPVGFSGTASLTGSIIANTGARTFAGGGYYGGGADLLAPLGRSGPGFFPAVPGWARIFAEPATGGEWYIPRIGQRARQYAIWADAGRSLGFAPHVGNGGPIVINAPIQIDASNSGADPEALADMISRRVNHALADVARELENTRRS